MNKKLILISGSPCVGKTAVGTQLFEEQNKKILKKKKKLM